MRQLPILLALLQFGCASPSIPLAQSSPVPVPATTIAPDSPKMQHVKVEKAGYEMMPGAEVTAPGSVEANPNLIAQINLPVAGRVTQVLVRQGDPVQAGQSLLTVLSPEATTAQADVHSAEAQLRQARATVIEAEIGVTKALTALRQAQADQARVKDLFAHDAIARKEVILAQTNVHQARADLSSAKAMVEQAKAGIDSALAQREQALARLRLLGVGPNDANPTIVVSSPLTGKVLELKVVAGEYHSDLGESVMTVVDLASVWMTSNVPESQIRWIERGEPVHITLDAFPGQRFQGRVERIADTLDPKTRTVKVMTALANPRGRFRPEMFGRIHHVHDAHKMTVVPATAIVEGDDGHEVVYVESEPGSFLPREVELGVRKDSKVAILSGLSPGEKVVVDGALLLKK